jgi:hypothetical protein
VDCRLAGPVHVFLLHDAMAFIYLFVHVFDRPFSHCSQFLKIADIFVGVIDFEIFKRRRMNLDSQMRWSKDEHYNYILLDDDVVIHSNALILCTALMCSH